MIKTPYTAPDFISRHMISDRRKVLTQSQLLRRLWHSVYWIYSLAIARSTPPDRLAGKLFFDKRTAHSRDGHIRPDVLSALPPCWLVLPLLSKSELR